MNKQIGRIFHTRAEVSERKLTGYASVFDSPSELMWGVREFIAPGAFDDTDMSDVRALFNHDPNFMLGRTTSGTLKVSVDEKGLFYEIALPDTAVANDLLKLVERGDITQSSFGFTIRDAAFEVRDGEDVYVIKSVERLYDVSPVTFPAYPETSVMARSNTEFEKMMKAKQEEMAHDIWRLKHAERKFYLLNK